MRLWKTSVPISYPLSKSVNVRILNMRLATQFKVFLGGNSNKNWLILGIYFYIRHLDDASILETKQRKKSSELSYKNNVK